MTVYMPNAIINRDTGDVIENPFALTKEEKAELPWNGYDRMTRREWEAYCHVMNGYAIRAMYHKPSGMILNYPEFRQTLEPEWEALLDEDDLQKHKDKVGEFPRGALSAVLGRMRTNTKIPRRLADKARWELENYLRVKTED